MQKFGKSPKGKGYITEDGCYYETLADCIQIGLLDFCGCGDPDENLRYIQAGLQHILNRGEAIDRCSSYEDVREACRELDKAGKELFGNDDAECFFYYWADSNGLTDHGTSIPGWITQEGEELLVMIENALDAAKE